MGAEIITLSDIGNMFGILGVMFQVVTYILDYKKK